MQMSNKMAATLDHLMRNGVNTNCFKEREGRVSISAEIKQRIMLAKFLPLMVRLWEMGLRFMTRKTRSR